MVSAYALRPGGGTFGSSDVKRNARRFLERGLVLSAIFHLALLGGLRISAEREAAREGPTVPTFRGVIRTYRWIPLASPPLAPRAHVGGSSGAGRIMPVDFTPKVEGPDVRSYVLPGEGPNAGREGPEGPGPSEPPREARPDRFQVAESPPVPIQTPKPGYPEWAREAGLEGTVLLRALVGKDGSVRQVVIVRGPKGLDEEAARAIRRWIFKVAETNGQPVEVWLEIPVSFQL